MCFICQIILKDLEMIICLTCLNVASVTGVYVIIKKKLMLQAL